MCEKRLLNSSYLSVRIENSTQIARVYFKINTGDIVNTFLKVEEIRVTHFA